MSKINKVPRFENEDEEREFWATHSSADYFDPKNIVKLDLSQLKPTTETISLRMPVSLLDRIKILANKKDVPYQSLIKIYLDKSVTEELQAKTEYNTASKQNLTLHDAKKRK